MTDKEFSDEFARLIKQGMYNVWLELAEQVIRDMGRHSYQTIDAAYNLLRMSRDKDYFTDISRLSKGSDGQLFCCAGKKLVRDPYYDTYSCERCTRRFDREKLVAKYGKALRI